MPSNNKEYMRNWRSKNSDKMHSYRKKWELKNPKKAKESKRKYRLTNRIELRKKAHQYFEAHLKTCRKRSIRNSQNHRHKVRKEILQFLGNQCSNPYNLKHGDFLSDFRCLQIDHVNGRGKRSLSRFKDAHRYYEQILKEIKSGSKEYQLLCANCNWIKRFENREDRRID